MRFIGSKIRILNQIEMVINENNITGKSFCDIFAGSGSVGRYFKNRFAIISNDLLFFSYVIQKATIEINVIPDFKTVNKYLGMNIFDYFANIETYTLGKYPKQKLYLYNNFSEKNGRMYLASNNAKKIDLWRLELEDFKYKKLISDDEYFYILACIIETTPYFSNISGTYGAFLKTWDPRAVKNIELVKIDVENNHKSNIAYNLDSEDLIGNIEGDILYIDPPYNRRQYLPNYHLLETIAKYDYPKVKGVTGVRDYSNEKSKFCIPNKVSLTFENLVSKAKFQHIIVSYSTDGIMTENEIEEILRKYSIDNTCKTYRIPHTRFKSRKLINNSDLYELIFYIKKKDCLQLSDNFIKSPLNYIGGKYKLLKQIIPVFPNNISVFLDLFSGGFNVGANVNASKIIANDINKYIIELYNFLKLVDIFKLINDIEALIKKYSLSKTNSDGYYALRKDYNLNKSPLLLFVLTCYSFNHQIRYNNNFEFNNPFGKNRSEYNSNIQKNLIKFVNRIQSQNVDFICQDFTQIDLNILDTNSLVYCDPPYLISNGSYNDGTRGFGNWTDIQEKKLFKFLDTLNSNNIRFVLSNVLVHKGMKNELLEKWAMRYNTIIIDSNYNNSNYQSTAKNHDTTEVLITNY